MSKFVPLRRLIPPFLDEGSLLDDEIRQRLFISVGALLAFPMLALFSYTEFLHDQKLMAALCLIGMGLMVLNVYTARAARFSLLAPRFTMGFVCVLILAQVLHDRGAYTFFWPLVIPTITVFVFGRREGTIWTLAIFAILTGILLWPEVFDLHNLQGVAYDFSFTYAVVSAFAFGYETLRSRARVVADERAERLLEEHDKLRHAESEVRKSNRHLEDALQLLTVSEARFRDFAEISSDWLFETDEKLRFTYISDQLESKIGIAPSTIVGQPITSIWDYVEQENSDDIGELEELFRQRKAYRDFRSIMKLPRGDFHFTSSAIPIFDADQRFIGYRGTAQDTTAYMHSQAELRSKDLALHQAHKMEAIGQLTSGIAHDFNNLLTVINGNLELLKLALANEDIDLTRLDAASTASEQAAALTAKLLAFARCQPLNPEAVDVHKLLEGMEDMLQRTLGEKIDIEFSSPADLWFCRADSTQLQNAILNLTINARDAMPEGGQLRVESCNHTVSPECVGEIQSGDYVVIRVIDTGTGMSQSLVGQVFEPFFSTKPQGEGSGLGLSMVYGFVMQSGGHVEISSEEGIGTQVAIYLPREESEHPSSAPEITEDNLLDATSNRILVVEDDPAVRELVVSMLQSLGYETHSTDDAKSAVQLFHEISADLLITDVVLAGGRSGIEIANTLRAETPSAPILLMSGYPEHAISAEGNLETGIPLLQKPFGVAELSKIVCSVMRRASN